MSDSGKPADGWTLLTVTYNSRQHLLDNWSPLEPPTRWIVVDNASTDDSVDVAHSLGAEVIRLDENVGFGKANNVGLDRVSSPWTMFVNPDVRVGKATDLHRLAAVSDANGGALVAPQLLNSDGSEQPNARGLPFLVDKVANRAAHMPGARLDEYARTGFSRPTYAAWAIGAAIGGPTETLRSLGGWDERFFLYYEDHDLGLRAWSAGTPVVLDPSVRWVHQWQRATTRMRLKPWSHEFASMRRFYALYPELRSRRTLDRARRTHAMLTSRLWSDALEPSSEATAGPE